MLAQRGEEVAEPARAARAGAIRRGIAKTREGIPVLLEFLTEKEISFSIFK